MSLRPLGNSPFSIAPLAFGGNVFGWSADETQSFELLDAFVDAGGNLFDCADAYRKIVRQSGFSRRKTLDRMIAATALVNNATLVTANGPDFADIPGLALEIWSAPNR